MGILMHCSVIRFSRLKKLVNIYVYGLIDGTSRKRVVYLYTLRHVTQ